MTQNGREWRLPGLEMIEALQITARNMLTLTFWVEKVGDEGKNFLNSVNHI